MEWLIRSTVRQQRQRLPQLLLLAAVTVYPSLVLPVRSGCLLPAVANFSVVIDATSVNSVTVNVRLTNASAALLPSLIVYYFNMSGALVYAGPRNATADGPAGFILSASKLPLVAGVAVRNGYGSPPVNVSFDDLADNQQAVVFIRTTDGSPPPLDAVENAERLHQSFRDSSCTGQALMLSPGLLTNADLNSAKLCQLGNRTELQYVAVNSTGTCPEVVVSELALGASSSRYVELFCEGCTNANLSGYSIVFFDLVTNVSLFVIPLNRTTDGRGFLLLSSSSTDPVTQLPASTVSTRGVLVAVYATALNSRVSLNLSCTADRSGLVAAVAYSDSSATRDQLQVQLSSLTRSIKQKFQFVLLGRSRSENMSLSYCISSVAEAPVRFLLSQQTPADVNDCGGVPAADSRHILHINEFNADVPGTENGANLTEFVELIANVTANTSLDNYYVAFYRGITLTAFHVTPLAGISATPTKQFILIGTVDVCRPCDATMMGNTIHNGMSAIAIHYREEGPILNGWPASRDGLVDAYVYTAESSPEHPRLVDLLGLHSSHIVYEDDSAFALGDESVGLCGDNVMSLMLLTPGLPNNCLDNPSALKPRSSSTSALAVVYINEWQPLANGSSSYVELVGPPDVSLYGLALKVALLNSMSGAVLHESSLLKLDWEARLSPTGLYALSSSGLNALAVDALAAAALGGGSLTFRLMLATVLNKTVWTHAEPLVPLDSVDVRPSSGAATAAGSQSGTRFVQLNLTGGMLSASRCRLNASAPASAAANSPAFDPRPVTPNAANNCPPPFGVLINEVMPPSSSNPSPFVELLVQVPSTASVTLDGFVLVYWSGDTGAAVKSLSLSKSPAKLSSTFEWLVVLEGPPLGARHVVALYYNYDFLYPAGKRLATAERLLASAAYSIDFDRPPLSNVLIETFRNLYPSRDMSFYGQGVVTVVDATKPLSLSRCPGSTSSTVDAFEPMPPTRQLSNVACTAQPRGAEAITVQQGLQLRVRINELSASAGSFVELLSAEPGLPLTGLSLGLMWSDGSGNWSSANYSRTSVQPTNGSIVSASGYYKAELAASDIHPPPGALVLCVVLVSGGGAGSLATMPEQLSFAAKGTGLVDQIVDALAIFVGNGSASPTVASGSEWPLTPPYAPLSSTGGLLGTTSFSRCYVGTAAAKVNVAFAAAANATPGAANHCPLPPVLVQHVCTAGGLATGEGRNLSLKLEASAAPLLPLERMRVVTYGGEQSLLQFTSLDVPLSVSAIGKDGTLAVSTPYRTKANDTLLAVAVYFYPPEISTATRPTVSLLNDQPPLLVHALMLHYRPCGGPWQQLSEDLKIDATDIPLVPMPGDAMPICIARCQMAADWKVRLVENIEAQSCPVQSGESVLINEVDIKQPGLDLYEFIELKGPGGLDASDYMIVVYIVNKTAHARFEISLKGRFSPTGFFVIGSSNVGAAMPFPGNVQSVLSNDGGAVALYKRRGTQGTGLIDVVLYATSTKSAEDTGKFLIPDLLLSERSEVLVEDTKLYGGNGTLSRCFCNTTSEPSCFTLSMHPTPGGDNFCIRKEQPLSLKFCLNRTVADDPTGIKEGLATAIGSNCSCVFGSYHLSDMKTCGAGVQFDAYGTSPEHLTAIGRSFENVLSHGILSDNEKGLIRAISSNCSLDCAATVVSIAQGGSNSGIVAGIVVTVGVLIAAGIVTVYCIRKRQADRGFQMARFDGTFDDDDSFAGDNASGRVTFSNPFRPPAAERRQYAKL